MLEEAEEQVPNAFHGVYRTRLASQLGRERHCYLEVELPLVHLLSRFLDQAEERVHLVFLRDGEVLSKRLDSFQECGVVLQ
jgi:hypothetical protein